MDNKPTFYMQIKIQKGMNLHAHAGQTMDHFTEHASVPQDKLMLNIAHTMIKVIFPSV